MSKGIIAGPNLNVVSRPTQKGLEVLVPCQECQRTRRVLHPWPELQAMVQGQPVRGVQPRTGGWVISVPCGEDCMTKGPQGLGQTSIQYALSRQEVLGLLGG